ncbi:MAG: IPT/TIG domain-containing protein [Ignavibacteriaceae bacterium]
MKKEFQKILFYLGILFISVLFGCSEDTTPSLIDISKPNSNPPQINSINPPNAAIAGVTQITIDGSNFSANKSENFVYFNGIPAQVVDASETRLVVIPPKDVVSDSVALKVSKIGADNFSNILIYQLKPALVEIKNSAGVEIFDKNRLAYSLATDAAGNLYVSATEFGVKVGIKKVTPTGDLTDFAPAGAETFFNILKYGANSTLYGARRVKAIFEITEGVASKVYVSSSTGLGSINDLDFDQNGNLWGGGTGNNNIYRVNPAKEIKAFPFAPNVEGVRIFDNYLYVLGVSSNNEFTIYRLQIISSDSLGAAEAYFNFTEKIGATVSARAITFSADGDLYVGTDRDVDPIIVVHSDLSFGPLYPGVIENMTKISSFAWDKGIFLYYIRDQVKDPIDATKILRTQSVFRLDMQKLGAPHYGRD